MNLGGHVYMDTSGPIVGTGGGLQNSPKSVKSGSKMGKKTFTDVNWKKYHWNPQKRSISGLVTLIKVDYSVQGCISTSMRTLRELLVTWRGVGRFILQENTMLFSLSHSFPPISPGGSRQDVIGFCYCYCWWCCWCWCCCWWCCCCSWCCWWHCGLLMAFILQSLPNMAKNCDN